MNPIDVPSADMKRPRKAGARAVRLSRGLRPLFWDHHFGQLTWESDADLIIGRILAHGDWKAIQWLRGLLSKDALREWIQRRRAVRD